MSVKDRIMCWLWAEHTGGVDAKSITAINEASMAMLSLQRDFTDFQIDVLMKMARQQHSRDEVIAWMDARHPGCLTALDERYEA